MDDKEILTRFKDGTLDRARAAALLAAGAEGRAGGRAGGRAESWSGGRTEVRATGRSEGRSEGRARDRSRAGSAPVLAPVPPPAPAPASGLAPVPSLAPVPGSGTTGGTEGAEGTGDTGDVRGAGEARSTGDPRGTRGTREAHDAPYTGRVAVVGVSGRFPGAPDPDALWRRLRAGRAAGPGPLPKDRPGGGGAGTGHYLDRVQDFDPVFFGIEPAEAALMDPQERIFLETAWEAFEDAGCTGGRLDALTAPDGTPRSVGVFVGASAGDYALLAAEAWARGARAMPRRGHWSLPNRLSGLLGLTGPSQSVDTAESSVLVALDLALAALRRRECEAALVGGAHLLLHPASRSPGAGECAGALLLKPLDRALADGDTVHAVVLGGAVAHTGGPGLARTALRRTGPGTQEPGLREDAGTAAASVGDAGAATGVAVLTRAVLQLRHRVLLPGPDRPEAEPWTRSGPEPRRASATVRGAGGVEAHVILEEFRPEPPALTDLPELPEFPQLPNGGSGTPAPATAPAGELVLLSAPTPAHLAATAARLLGRIAGRDAPPLPVLARSLRTGRAPMDCRFAVLVHDLAELSAALERLAAGAMRGVADLRGGAADPQGLGAVPETRAYLAGLWEARRLPQLRDLWLSGVDADWAALEPAAGPGAVTVPLPPSAFLRTPLWLPGAGEGG
ncbi:polyketide synthase [Streptomyces sp. bgisy082]|uniref:beta-ketoacyl [acyl carrier protein] synthase domain-containing protein n=1 Tax=Streptomyces sp. bgisy082 TaxID=3413776 RepID=UPI003D7481E1